MCMRHAAIGCRPDAADAECNPLSPVHTGDKLATKSTVAVYGQLCCRFWWQIGNNLNSTAFCGWHCCQLGRLCHHCVWGESNMVDFVDFQLEFNFADSVYRALVPPCELILLRTLHTKRRRDCLSLSCRQHNSLVDVNTKLSEAFQMYHSLMQGYATAARQPDQVYTRRVVMCLWHTNFLYVRQ